MRKNTSAARMPLWKWILCLLGGFLIFTLLQGLTGLIPGTGHFWLDGLINILVAFLFLFLYALWISFTERRPVDELNPTRMFPDTGKGLLLGVVYFGIVVGVIALLGCYRITGAHFNAPAQISGFLIFLGVAVFEEIVFRGIIFRLIDERWNTAAALIVSSLIFGAAHLLNPGADWWSAIAIAIEAGLLLGAAYKCTGTLWFPIGIHWAWNYVQGYILGFSVSGTPVATKLFSPIITGPDLVTGGIFGAEASLPAVGAGLLFTVILLLCRRRDKR